MIYMERPQRGSDRRREAPLNVEAETSGTFTKQGPARVNHNDGREILNCLIFQTV